MALDQQQPFLQVASKRLFLYAKIVHEMSNFNIIAEGRAEMWKGHYKELN